MLKDEIEKKNSIKKIIRVNLLNLWSRSWDQDNLIKNKSKQTILNSQSTQC